VLISAISFAPFFTVQLKNSHLFSHRFHVFRYVAWWCSSSQTWGVRIKDAKKIALPGDPPPCERDVMLHSKEKRDCCRMP